MTTRRVLAVAGVAAVSLVARLCWLDGDFDVNEPDEIMYLHVAENFARGVPYPRYDYETRYRDGLFVVPPFPLYTAGLVFKVVGPSLRNFRAMNVVFGIASVGAFAAFAGLYLQGLPLLVSALIFALSPVALRESTQAMLGAPAVFWLLLSLWAYVRHERDGRWPHLVLCAACLGATAACKQYAILVGGLLAFHWCWQRWRRGSPSLGRLAAAAGIAIATFGLLVPWVFWRPRDSLHLYLYQSLIVHVMALLRGHRGAGTLFTLPYPTLMLAHGLVSILGLIVFARTWRRKGDVALFYGVLLGLPIIVAREARYLSLGLPCWCLFAGYLIAAVDELAPRQSRLARVANGALAVMLVGSVLPVAVGPPRKSSLLVDACRYVRLNTADDDLILTNYWRPVAERFAERRVAREWVDGEGRRLIEAGRVKFVILDSSPYTRRVLHTPERAQTAAWVRRTYPLVWMHQSGGRGGEAVYLTRMPRRAERGSQ